MPFTRLTRPTFASVSEYAARLGDLAFWTPHVVEALARHGLPVEAPELGTGGTFPTFLVGRYVVKLFGELFSGADCHEVERSLHRILLSHPEVPAPVLVADGHLFDDGWPWPYLITTRVPGIAWRDAALHPTERASLARRLGSIVRRVHELPPPAGSVWERDWLAEMRADCVERQRRWGVLPTHLIEQIEQFVVEPSPARCLVHADLHHDHLFVEGGRLVGIIDWGDAFVTDPYYELPALHLRTFRGDPRLLRAFLDGYGWEVGSDFPRRAMTMTLVREFNVLDGPNDSADLSAISTLEELADRLWELS